VFLNSAARGNQQCGAGGVRTQQLSRPVFKERRLQHGEHSLPRYFPAVNTSNRQTTPKVSVFQVGARDGEREPVFTYSVSHCVSAFACEGGAGKENQVSRLCGPCGRASCRWNLPGLAD